MLRREDRAEGHPLTTTSLTLTEAQQLFQESLVAKSGRTVATYSSSLRRFFEYLEDGGAKPAAVRVADLGETALAEFQNWLVRAYGREDRATISTYVAG